MMAIQGAMPEKGRITPHLIVPNAKAATQHVRWVMRSETKDRMVVEMYEPGPDGQEYRNMEIIGTRAP